MDFQKELNEWADWFIPHDSKDLRDALELNSFNQLNVEKLLAINGLSEAYAFRAKDSWKAWQAAKAQAQADTKRIDFLADKSQSVANVMLPTKIVERNLSSLRDAIDQAMMIEEPAND